jgi:hypothetical protein
MINYAGWYNTPYASIVRTGINSSGGAAWPEIPAGQTLSAVAMSHADRPRSGLPWGWRALALRRCRIAESARGGESKRLTPPLGGEKTHFSALFGVCPLLRTQKMP